MGFRESMIEDLRTLVYGPTVLNPKELKPKFISPNSTYFYGCGALNKANAGRVPEDVSEVVLDQVEEDIVDINDDAAKAGKRDRFEGESDNDADENHLASSYKPSACGLSFCVKVSARLEWSYGYSLYTSTAEQGSDGVTKRSWNGVPLASSGSWTVAGRSGVFDVDCDGIKLLRFRVRRVEADIALVTASLVLDHNSGIESDSIHQVSLSVVTDKNKIRPIDFLDKSTSRMKWSPDRKLQALLYWDRKEWAVGHGCAAKVDFDAARVTCAVEFLPQACVDSVDFQGDVPADILLRMRNFTGSLSDDAFATLKKMVDQYGRWIANEFKDGKGDLPEYLEETIKNNRKKCEDACSRMERGLDLLWQGREQLKQGQLAEAAWLYKSFCFMNEAMREQSLRRKFGGGDGNGLEERLREIVKNDQGDKEPCWRAFQIAFVLMSLPNIVNKGADKQPYVDLIWFPTGGGKTEAYLALAATMILYYRMQKNVANLSTSGTLVLMRYTLRLLTQQQCDRALAMVSALNTIEDCYHEDFQHQEAPITLGFWAGNSASFNLAKEARKAALNGNHNGQEGKPLLGEFVISSCPHCGSKIRVAQGDEKKQASIVYNCMNSGCRYAKMNVIPFLSVDEDIYAKPPTFLVGTVDKFAMLTERPEARSLFGFQEEMTCDRSHLPPRLIIQDELHLLDSSLGSIVGAYEKAVQLLCQGCHVDADGSFVENDKRLGWPCIVGATATINQAQKQSDALYGRECQVFPPPAMKAGMTYFSKIGVVDAARDNRRKYVGCLLPRISGGASQIVVAAGLIASARVQSLPDRQGSQDFDGYGTLMAYFTTLRELATFHSREQVEINQYVRNFIEWMGKQLSDIPANCRFKSASMELTSRKEVSDLRKTMDDLQKPLEDSQLHLLRATNMIQVGLDVPRLDLMLMYKQPHTTSEYIQASSRVGRNTSGPGGVVIDLLRPLAPRDRSHYEHFYHYHDTFYARVEPTTITVDSPQVEERTAIATTVILIRLMGNLRSPNDTREVAAKIRASVIGYQKSRLGACAQGLLDGFDRTWGEPGTGAFAAFHPPFQTDVNNQGPLDQALLGRFGYTLQNAKPYKTMTAMRSVDDDLVIGIDN